MNEQAKQQLEAMQGELAQRVNAMSRICAGMTLEEMQNAAFDYKSLVEIVQRRDVRNVCVPDVDWLAQVIRAVDGNHSLGAGALAENIVNAMTSKMGEQK